MGHGGCYALYFMVENREYEWYNQNVKDIVNQEFGGIYNARCSCAFFTWK